MTCRNTTGEQGRFLQCFRWNQVVIHGWGNKFSVWASVCQKWLNQQSEIFKENTLPSKNLTKDGQCSSIALLCSLLAQPSQAGIGLWGFSTQYWQYFQHRLPRLTIPKIFQANWQWIPNPNEQKLKFWKKIEKLDLTVGFVFFGFLVFFSILYFNISFFLLLIFLYFDQLYSLKDNHDINILSIKNYIKNMYCQ